jgi:hypothetical protein
MPAPIEAKYLVIGDRVEFAGQIVDMTAVHPLPNRVEVTFIPLDGTAETAVWDPMQEVTLLHTATELEAVKVR